MCNMLFTLHCIFCGFFCSLFTEHAKNNESQRCILNCSQAVLYLKARNKTSRLQTHSQENMQEMLLEEGFNLKNHCRKFPLPHSLVFQSRLTEKRLPVDHTSSPHRASASKMFSELNVFLAVFNNESFMKI